MMSGASILIGGCSTGTTDPNTLELKGIVRTSSGQPVAGAYINLFYSSLVYPAPKASKTLPTTSIEFDIPHSGYLVVNMENYVHEVVSHLYSDSVAAGLIEVTWGFRNDQGKDLYTDCYWGKATLDGEALPTVKMLAVTYQYDAPDPVPFAVTNSMGRFSIPYGRLPLNETFQETDPVTGTSREVRIGPTDEVIAFTPTSHGSAYVRWSRPQEIVIVLNQ